MTLWDFILPCRQIRARLFASAAKTVGEALALFERYFRIVNEAVRLKLTRIQNGAILHVDFVGLSRHQIHQNAEFGIAVILKALREVVGRNIRPTKVSFVSGRASYLREFERFLGCQIEFGAPSGFSRSAMRPRGSAALERARFVMSSRRKCRRRCRTAA
jgi:hypothetical protein